MIPLITIAKAQKLLSTHIKELRLAENLTQKGLAQRAGVSLATFRKFEQTGIISLTSFLHLLMALNRLDVIRALIDTQTRKFNSLEEVLKINEKPKRQRGRRT